MCVMLAGAGGFHVHCWFALAETFLLINAVVFLLNCTCACARTFQFSHRAGSHTRVAGSEPLL